MKKATADSSASAWLGQYIRDQHPSATATPTFRQLRTPAERKAEETSHAARAVTDAAAAQRRTATARLKAARLAREAAGGTAAPEVPKKKRSSSGG